MTPAVEYSRTGAYYRGPDYAPGGFYSNHRRFSAEAIWGLSLRIDARIVGPLALTIGGHAGNGTLKEQLCGDAQTCFPPFPRKLRTHGADLGVAVRLASLSQSDLMLRGGPTLERAHWPAKGDLHEQTLSMHGWFIGGAARRSLRRRFHVELAADYRWFDVPTEQLAQTQADECGCIVEYEQYKTHRTGVQLGFGAHW